MAMVLRQRHDTQWVLISAGGMPMGNLYRRDVSWERDDCPARETWELFMANAYEPTGSFPSAVRCADWLGSTWSMSVEVIPRRLI